MRKNSVIFICLAILISFSACDSKHVYSSEPEILTSVESSEPEILTSVESSEAENEGEVLFIESENLKIISKEGTEYIFAGMESEVECFGEQKFIGHVAGEKKSFVHLVATINTGMYSVGGSKDVLIRYFPDSEFSSVYVKSDLLERTVSLENCIRFVFLKNKTNDKNVVFNSKKGITNCKEFLKEIKNGQNAEEAKLIDLVKQPDGYLKNCYGYGAVYGIIQEDLNLVIPLYVTSYDDKAYSIRIGDTEYVLSKDWLDKLQK